MRRLNWVTILFVSFLVWSNCFAEESDKPLVGPYLQNPKVGEVTVVFETPQEVAATVLLGKEGEDLSVSFDSDKATWHEVELTGLEPGERYCYKVVADQIGFETETYCFRALPELGEPVRIVFFGDTRSQPEVHRQVVEAIVAEQPDVVVHTGDMVSHGEIDDEWREFFQIEAPLVCCVPELPVIGNHDQEDRDFSLYAHYFVVPVYEKDGMSSKELFYYKDVGPVRIFVGDDVVTVPNKNNFQGELIFSLLDEAATNSNLTHFILSFHEGPYSAKEGRSGSFPVRLMVEDLYAKGATAIISGHDHHFWHGIAACGLEFIVSGGGGAPLYDVEPNDRFGVQTVAYAKAYNYIVLDATKDQIDGVVKTPEGEVLDSFTWEARLAAEPNGEVGDNTTESTIQASGSRCAASGVDTWALVAVFVALWAWQRRRR